MPRKSAALGSVQDLEHVWSTTRRLERDLERLASIYGLDCRGVGFTALANALVHSGWKKDVTEMLVK